MRDYQESVTTGQTDGQTYRQTDGQRQTPDKVIYMCRYASQAIQQGISSEYDMVDFICMG